MSDKLKEQLSAMLDNELDEQEYELLIHRLKQDRELQSMWSRYQVVGEAMRRNLVNTTTIDLVNKLRKQIAPGLWDVEYLHTSVSFFQCLPGASCLRPKAIAFTPYRCTEPVT